MRAAMAGDVEEDHGFLAAARRTSRGPFAILRFRLFFEAVLHERSQTHPGRRAARGSAVDRRVARLRNRSRGKIVSGVHAEPLVSVSSVITALTSACLL